MRWSCHRKLVVTLGDPLAMPFYALSTLSLVEKLPSILQAWYGYTTNASKSQYAKVLFQGTSVNVTCECKPHLGSPLWLANYMYIQQFVKMKVTSRNKEFILLSSIAIAQPQVFYSAYTHWLSSRWSYLARTTQGISHLFASLENTLRNCMSDLLAKSVCLTCWPIKEFGFCLHCTVPSPNEDCTLTKWRLQEYTWSSC